MNLIGLLLRTSRLTVFLVFITGLLSGGARVQLIAVINNIINHTGSPKTNSFWGFILLLLVVLISSVASQVLLVQLAQGTLFKLRMLLSRRILACPLRQLEEIGIHRLLTTLTEDIESLSEAFSAFPFLFIDMAVVFGCLVYLGVLSWVMFLLLVVLMVVGMSSYQQLAKRAKRFRKRARQERDELFHHLRAITEGTKELKLHAERASAFLSQDLYATAAAVRDQETIGLNIFAVAASWGQLLFFVAIGLFVFALPKLGEFSDRSLLTSYIITIIYMLWPLENITRRLPTMNQASIALEKVESLGLMLATDTSERGGITDLNANPSWQSLELVSVTHTYRGEQETESFILGPIDLTFHPGEIVFIVGGNGSGKSTLGKLITGLYTPQSGEIRLDGTPITDDNREWYRQHFSAVFSDFYLFGRLVGLTNNNLDTRAQQFLVQLQLNHKVEIKDGVLSTTALSQGQRKRIALLTAYLEDRPIYLFDEWAADQDPYFKRIFYTQILPELTKRGKTVLVISHDDRYFHAADRIVKLEYGRLESQRLVNQKTTN
ncbi:MAG TPA: cyclic peptide export ABC transporter [Chroococcales cyanobacterium]